MTTARGRRHERLGGHAAGLRRLAAQIVVQLPEDEADALEVLRLAGALVTGFLRGGGRAPCENADNQVVSLRPAL